MSASKYIEKSDIVAWVEFQNEELDESDIPDVILKLADARVDSMLLERSVRDISAKSDKLNLLWAAALCMCLEMLCYRGQLSWSTGDLALHRLNRVTHAFQRWQPMFFFASGGSEPFQGLLPHETFRMMAYAFVVAYGRKDFWDDKGTIKAVPKIFIDRTSRGYDWNTDADVIEAYDEENEAIIAAVEELEEEID